MSAMRRIAEVMGPLVLGEVSAEDRWERLLSACDRAVRDAAIEGRVRLLEDRPPTHADLRRLWEERVRLPARLAAAWLGGGDPWAALDSVPGPRPEWLAERKAELAGEWGCLRRHSGARQETLLDPPGPSAESLRIPAAFRLASLADFQAGPTRAVGLAELLGIEEAGPSVSIVGAAGRGKSHLAAALALRWGALWIDASDLVRAGRGGPDPDGARHLSVARQHPRIVLDDIGAIPRGGNAAVVVLKILRSRDNWGLQTIATSDIEPAEIGEQLDRSLGSRLEGYAQVRVSGPDRRKRT